MNENFITTSEMPPLGFSIPDAMSKQESTIQLNGSNMINHNRHFWKSATQATAAFFLILLLTACGAGGGNDTSNTSGGNAANDGSTTGGGNTSSSAGTGTATLSWLPPTEHTDGSPLTLSGYKIYYGTEIGNYTNTINIDNAGLVNYMIDNLPSGHTYFFVITSIDSNGLESDYSVVASKTIPS